jgi:hypothetical protein
MDVAYIGIWKETVITCLKVLSQGSSGEAGPPYKKIREKKRGYLVR